MTNYTTFVAVILPRSSEKAEYSFRVSVAKQPAKSQQPTGAGDETGGPRAAGTLYLLGENSLS